MIRRFLTGVAALGVATIAFAAPPVDAQTVLPDRVAPPGLRSIDDASGGRIVTGALGEGMGSDAVFRAGLRRLGGYFGHSVHLGGVVRSNDGRVTMTVFDARLGGIPVGGLALTAAGAGAGASQVAFVFDAAQRFPRTIGPLVAHLQRIAPAAPAGVAAASRGGDGRSLQAEIAAVPTVTQRAADGTVSVGLPSGWTIKRLAEGSVVADDADGSEVVYGMVFPMVDPRGPAGMGIRVPYDADPARAYATIVTALARMGGAEPPQFLTTHEKPVPAPPGVNGAEVSGTSRVRGRTLRFDEFVGVGQQGQMGGWTVAVSGAVAPVERFEANEPAMGAIMASYRLDNGRRQEQVAQIIASGWAQSRAGIAHMNAVTAADQATVDASMRNARQVQDGIDRSTAGFVHYLNDSDVVRGGSGAHYEMGAASAHDLTTFDPQHFTQVPVSQYVKGVDY